MAGLLAGLLPLAACTELHSLSPVSSDKLAESRIEAGDTVHVVTSDGRRMSLKITEIRPTELAGLTVKPDPGETEPAGREVVLPYSELASVEYRQFSAKRAAGVVGVSLLVAAGLAIATLEHSGAGIPAGPG